MCTKSKKAEIILDTNFLMLPYRIGKDVFTMLEEMFLLKPSYITIKSVIKELENIRSNDPIKERRGANLALSIIKETPVKILDDSDIEGNTDDKILKIALKRGAIVATNDRGLRKKLREKGVTVIFFRERDRRLWLEGEIY